ncbi:MAG: tripartite motif-containing protein 71 [Solirubrobacteraceae bacterium]|jgi:DNA-binding beta-propeller fold protein YncE|nr:tripartite motif-containing protein 71 [Solirubrobacteraceae bacterium]
MPFRARSLRLLAPAALALSVLAAAPAARADCPGATPDTSCPYFGTGQIGQRGEGVLRFPQSVAVGPDGSVYVGDQASHVVQVFDPTGAFVREVGSPGTKPGQLTSVGGVAVAGDGTLLVADGTSRIDRFDAAGALLNSFGRNGTGVGEFRFGTGGGNSAGAGGGLAVSGDVVYVADTGNNRIQRFTIDGGHGAEIVPPGQLSVPQGLAVRGSRLTVADDRHHRLVVFDTGGHFIRTVGAGPGPAPGQLTNPYDVAADPSGRLFVADDLNHRVVRFSGPPAYPYKARWGSYGTGPGQLAYPRGIAADAQGNVYVANTGNDRIDVFDRGGTLLRSFGSSGRATGQFDQPLGVAADASGVRAVVDAVNGRVQLLGPDGSIVAVWGSPAPGPTLLPRPVAVAFDPAGNAYVLDQRRGRVLVFDRGSGGVARTIGAWGSGPGQMIAPSALTIDPSGTIWVADTGNGRVVRFDLAGDYLGAITGVGSPRGIAVTPDGGRIYVAGANSRIGVWDPSGAQIDEFGGTGNKLGKLQSPGQMTLDAAGNLWVADRGNNRVQEFGPNGERLLAFGARGTDPGQFVHPTGVSIDCNGVLTVTDSDNNRVQQFALAAPSVTPCVALAPPANPPAPKLPTLPAPFGPQVTLRTLRTTGALTSRNVPLRVGCDTGCALSVTATVTPAARPKRHRRAVTVTLKPIRQQFAAGDTHVVRLTITRAQVTRLRRALHGRRSLLANLEVTATPAAGQPTVVAKELKLRA